MDGEWELERGHEVAFILLTMSVLYLETFLCSCYLTAAEYLWALFRGKERASRQRDKESRGC